jgi:thiol-disulfide isomerase/thioredoxin
MQPRHRRILVGVVVLVLVQAAALAIYLGVKRARSTPDVAAFASERLTPRAAPELAFTRADGTKTTLAQVNGKVVMVHFWATWCEPCRDELPGLLALAKTLESSGTFELLAVSVDDEWDDMRLFFDGTIPRAAVRADVAEVHRQFGASTLPDSYLVDPSGNLFARYAGARDWSRSAARTHLEQAVVDARN